MSVFDTGLGPTVPAVDPRKPFPLSPVAAVNSPIEVKANGIPPRCWDAVGQVNFRLPQNSAKEVATNEVSAARMFVTAADRA